MSDGEQFEEYEMPDPIATVIVQTDGKQYEIMLAGGGGVIRRHEVFKAARKDKKQARSICKLLWHLAYQTIQDEVLDDDQ
jgi:hypothetical protein